MDAILAEVIDKGVTADETERCKNGLIADAVYAQDNQATLARWFGAALMTGLTIEQVQAWPDHVRQVTVESVRKVARATSISAVPSPATHLQDTARPEEKRT
jgi:zinc protease